MTLGLSVFLVVVGAALRYALTWRAAGVDLPVLGLILMVAGIVISVICVLRVVLPLPGAGAGLASRGTPPIPPTRPDGAGPAGNDVQAGADRLPFACPNQPEHPYPYLDLERRTFGD